MVPHLATYLWTCKNVINREERSRWWFPLWTYTRMIQEQRCATVSATSFLFIVHDSSNKTFPKSEPLLCFPVLRQACHSARYTVQMKSPARQWFENTKNRGNVMKLRWYSLSYRQRNDIHSIQKLVVGGVRRQLKFIEVTNEVWNEMWCENKRTSACVQPHTTAVYGQNVLYMVCKEIWISTHHCQPYDVERTEYLQRQRGEVMMQAINQWYHFQYIRYMCRLATGWTVRGSNPGRGEIFRTCPDRPWGHPASYTMGTGSFLGVKRPGRGFDHPPPSSA
jgi:hypothetical protein